MSYVCALYHIVINTKDRMRTINPVKAPALHKFITSCFLERHCHVFWINGDANHIHMLVNVHPTVAIATLVGEVKRASSIWIKESKLFPEFYGWGAEYFACSVSPSHRQHVMNYIKNQHVHHHNQTFADEVRRLVELSGGTFTEKMLT
jgi:REP element-mobilizing transposase RayT